MQLLLMLLLSFLVMGSDENINANLQDDPFRRLVTFQTKRRKEKELKFYEEPAVQKAGAGMVGLACVAGFCYFRPFLAYDSATTFGVCNQVNQGDVTALETLINSDCLKCAIPTVAACLARKTKVVEVTKDYCKQFFRYSLYRKNSSPKETFGKIWEDKQVCAQTGGNQAPQKGGNQAPQTGGNQKSLNTGGQQKNNQAPQTGGNQKSLNTGGQQKNNQTGGEGEEYSLNPKRIRDINAPLTGEVELNPYGRKCSKYDVNDDFTCDECDASKCTKPNCVHHDFKFNKFSGTCKQGEKEEEVPSQFTKAKDRLMSGLMYYGGEASHHGKKNGGKAWDFTKRHAGNISDGLKRAGKGISGKFMEYSGNTFDFTKRYAGNISHGLMYYGGEASHHSRKYWNSFSNSPKNIRSDGEGEALSKNLQNKTNGEGK